VPRDVWEDDLAFDIDPDMRTVAGAWRRHMTLCDNRSAQHQLSAPHTHDPRRRSSALIALIEEERRAHHALQDKMELQQHTLRMLARTHTELKRALHSLQAVEVEKKHR